jgi:diguanylate cyclase (GGDEF)-like protein
MSILSFLQSSVSSFAQSRETASLVCGILVVVLTGILGLSRRRAAAIRRAEQRTHEMCSEGLIVVRSCGRVIESNGPAKQFLWGGTHASDRLELPAPILAMLSDPTAQHHRLRIRENQLIDLALCAEDDLGSGLRGILLHDVTEQQRGRRHLVQLAHYDSLTGLGNRRLFIDRLESAIEQSRSNGSLIALYYIDIDRFKEINDSFGHGVGDELLKSVAIRLKNQMLAWKSERGQGEALVARLAGDEFAVVVVGVSGPPEIARIAESILQRIAEPVQIEGRSLSSSGSVGVSTFPENGVDVEDLVKAADAALYVAKELGRARFVVYEDSFVAHAEQTRRIEKELRQAIQRGELQLHYQPKVELDGVTTAGFEALLRWYSKELGFVSPKDFIPVAEERGLICEIGAWCIEEACRQIRFWRDAGFETVPVSVNVSSIQFAESDLQRIVTDALVRHDIEPSMFEIELTESLILDDNDATALTLRDLRAIGVSVALDDFGTGYSALTYLNRFPLDVVKMDRGFLRGIEDDEAAAGIASAVIAMSHSLGFDVVAEGVDSERQSVLLKKLQCDQIQGFLYSPAVAGTEAARFLATIGASRPPMHSATAPAKIEQLLAADLSAPGSSEAIAKSPTGRSKPRSETERLRATRVLVIDDESSRVGPIAMRMMRFGADTHMVQDIDEASLFISQEEPIIDLLLVDSMVDLECLAVQREILKKINPGQTPRVMMVGEEPSDQRRSALRQAAVNWFVPGDPGDAEIRFFIWVAPFQGSQGRMKRSVRVPLDTTAWIRIAGDRRFGTLSNLSQRGAFVETEDTYDVGQSVRLEFKVEEQRVRVFGSVAYHQGEQGETGRPPGIGLIFYGSDRDAEDRISEIIERIWNRYLL